MDNELAIAVENDYSLTKDININWRNVRKRNPIPESMTSPPMPAGIFKYEKKR